MATQKNLGRHTKKDLIDKLQHATTYQFKDSITHLVQDPNDLEDKSMLTPLNSKIKHTEDGFEWDSIVIELGNDKDYVNAALPVILNSYDRPDFSWDKDHGNNKPLQKIDIKGERPVKYDLHEDEHGFHLHLKVFRYAFDLSKGTTAIAPNDVAKVADAQLAYTNKLLDQHGLALIGETNKAFSQHSKPTEETKTEVQAVINNVKSIDEVIESIEANSTLDEKLIDQSLTKDRKDLEALLQQAKVKQAEINDKILAKQTLADNKRLAFLLKQKEAEVSERDNLLVEKVTVITELKNTLEEKEELFINEKAKLTDNVNTLNETLSSKVEEIKELEDLNNQAQEEITAKEKEVSTLSSKVDNLNEVVQSKDKQITIQITQVERLEKALSSSEENNKAISESNAKLLERMQAIEQQLKDEKEQSAKKIAEQQKQFDDRLKALEESNLKLKEQNDIIIKENTIFKELTEMAIAKYKQATTIIKKLGEKLNSATDKKIVATAVKQATDYEKAVKQVDVEKKDIEDKMAAVRALFQKGKADTTTKPKDDNDTTGTVKPK